LNDYFIRGYNGAAGLVCLLSQPRFTVIVQPQSSGKHAVYFWIQRFW